MIVLPQDGDTKIGADDYLNAGTKLTNISNVVIEDLKTEDTLAFDAGGDSSFDERSELEAIATVSDDGTDVTIKLETETGGGTGTVTITLEGAGDGTFASLADLDAVYDLTFS